MRAYENNVTFKMFGFVNSIYNEYFFIDVVDWFTNHKFEEAQHKDEHKVVQDSNQPYDDDEHHQDTKRVEITLCERMKSTKLLEGKPTDPKQACGSKRRFGKKSW